MTTRTARAPARERLLDAADDLFHAHGIAATGVDAVLRRAGAAPATLYAHFAGKDALVAAYLQRRHQRWRQIWDEVLAEQGDPRERAVSVFDALDRLHGEDEAPRGCAFLGAAVEISDPDHPAHRWLRADTELLVERLATLARDAGAQDPDALAGELLLLYDGALAAAARARIDPAGSRPARIPPRDVATAAVDRHRERAPGAGGGTRCSSRHRSADRADGDHSGVDVPPDRSATVFLRSDLDSSRSTTR